MNELDLSPELEQSETLKIKIKEKKQATINKRKELDSPSYMYNTIQWCKRKRGYTYVHICRREEYKCEENKLSRDKSFVLIILLKSALNYSDQDIRISLIISQGVSGWWCPVERNSLWVSFYADFFRFPIRSSPYLPSSQSTCIIAKVASQQSVTHSVIHSSNKTISIQLSTLMHKYLFYIYLTLLELCLNEILWNYVIEVNCK